MASRMSVNKARMFVTSSPPSANSLETLRLRFVSLRIVGIIGSKLEMAPSMSPSCSKDVEKVGLGFLASRITSRSCFTACVTLERFSRSFSK